MGLVEDVMVGLCVTVKLRSVTMTWWSSCFAAFAGLVLQCRSSFWGIERARERDPCGCVRRKVKKRKNKKIMNKRMSG